MQRLLVPLVHELKRLMGALEVSPLVRCCLAELSIQLCKSGPPTSFKLSEEHADSSLHCRACVCARQIPVLIRVVVVVIKFKTALHTLQLSNLI